MVLNDSKPPGKPLGNVPDYVLSNGSLVLHLSVDFCIKGLLLLFALPLKFPASLQ